MNATDEGGDSLLHQAANTGAAGCTTLLLDLDAELVARNEGGETALLVAIRARSTETADVLLARGADPNVATTSGNSALGMGLLAGIWRSSLSVYWPRALASKAPPLISKLSETRWATVRRRSSRF